MGVSVLLTSLPAFSKEDFKKGEYVIKFEESFFNTTSSQKVEVIKSYFGGDKNVLGTRELYSKGHFLVKTLNPVSSGEIQKLSQEIKIVEPNYIYRTSVEGEYLDTPKDKSFKKQWSFNNTGQRLDQKYKMTPGADMKILKAWNENPRSMDAAKDIIVAVIDTGINKKHQDLIENLWVNPEEHGEWQPQNQDDVDRAPGCWNKSCNKLDDDGNGLVDDLHGANWSKMDTKTPPNVKFNDDQGHGTHCAGVIGAKHNELGMSGINNQVQLMALKFLTKKGEGTLAGAVEAISYAIEKNADVINASWGGPQASQVLYEAIHHASKEGVLFVAAAGNSSLNNDLFGSYPANYPLSNIVSVAATEFNNKKAFFTNHGKTNVHVSAPGHVIYSTFLGKKGYKYLSGTSMAAPHVSGLAAMLLGLYPDRFTDNPKWLRGYLMRTSDRKVYLNWLTNSGGIINASNAILGKVPVGNMSPMPRRGSWISSRTSIKSSHPYQSNTNESYEIKSRGAEWIRIKFGKYSLEEGVDQVELYDENGNLFDTLTGFGENKVSRPVKGSKVVVKFRTDANVNDWGYEIVEVSSLMGDE
jgi:subtilisin family serine protease